MKVYSYLEMSNSNLPDKKKNVDVILKLSGNVTIYDFYSQPFKPELIIELFEGWKRVEGTTFLAYVNEWGHKEIIFKRLQETYELKFGLHFLKPRTLDDFITDCRRAGTELTWKEQR